VFFELSADRVFGVAVGALAFEFQDEWWKGGDPFSHNISFEVNGGQPDLHNDEEHFGLMTIERTPKAAYGVMQSRFKNGQSAVQLDASPLIRAVSNGANTGNFGAEIFLGDDAWFTRRGGQYGGRGITVAVLDETTGIRMRDVRTYDTWLSPGGFGSFHANFPPLIQYIQSLPDGAIVTLVAGDEAGFINPNAVIPWADAEQWYQAFEAMGSTKVRQVDYRGGWAMIFRKGHGVLAENVSPPQAGAEVQAEVSLTLNPDAGRRNGPVVLSAAFDFDAPKPAVVLQFSEDVTGSIQGSDLRVVRLDDQQPVRPQAIAVTYDAEHRRARFTFPGLPGGVLPDGNYRATLPAGAVADGLGRVSPSAHAIDFFVLAGDADRDRTVGFNDLVVLAQNYGTSGKTFSQGNFDYGGAVAFADLVILAQRYDTVLPPPTAQVPALAAIPRGRNDRADTVFSPRPPVKPARETPKRMARPHRG
jgi:hypothetical protein